jgi:lipid-A-disaccharide synthase
MSDQKIFIICGEASGDLHAANLIRSLKEISPNLQVTGWGGDRLLAENVTVLKHIRELSFMGFLEVLLNIVTIIKNFRTCKEHISTFSPEVLILVDFPGFNLRMAEWAKKKGIKVIYYISPQLWAWKQGRIKKIQSFVDELYCILPFEKAYYEKFNVEVKYYGHPLLDEVSNFKSLRKEPLPHIKPVLALLPGSRMQEVKRKLPIMLEAAKSFPDYEIIVACSTQIPEAFYHSFGASEVRFIFGKTYDILNVASIAYVTSGTATLETALFKVPQVVCYKSSSLSFWIAKRVVKINYISLVNLILDRKLVEELIQGDCTSEKLVSSLKRIADPNEMQDQITAGYAELLSLLGGEGASDRIAKSMHETFLKENK